MEMFSPEVKDLFAAFSSAQGEFEPLGMSDSGQYGPFSTVGDYIKATRTAFKKHGLSLTQIPFKTNDGTDLVTVITHSSGQFMRSVIKLNPEKQTLQGFGASLTYIKRYALGAILGLDGESEDIDKKKDEVPYEQEVQQEEVLTEEHLLEILELIKNSENSKICKERILWLHKISSINQLPENKYENVKDYILNKFKVQKG